MSGLPVEKLGVILDLGANLNLGDLTGLGLILFDFVEENIAHNKDVNTGHASNFSRRFHITDDTRLL